MILPDYPIENEKQDQLKRFPLALKVVDMISTFSGKESFVIGVEGKWGSGKTSFINLALGQLDKNKIVYITFNPWNFSDETSLLRDFFIKFSEAVEKITGKKTGKRMKEYAGKLSELDLGISYEGFSFNPLKLLRFWSPDTSLEAIRKELDGALAGIEKKIVVVIDDIDRLDKKETKLILKLVKLTADFPKTIFVLAYDRNRVEDRITEKENGLEGGEYLKKIIQVSFSLPLPDKQELWNLLFKDLDISLDSVYGKAELSDIEQSRWNKMFYSGFNDLFETIRDIKRYISSLRLDWSIMGKSDVNKIDFLGVEAIRVFAPRFYEAIPANKDVFVELPGTFPSDKASVLQTRHKRYDELLNIISDERIRRCIDGICKEIFPELDNYSSSSFEDWERDLRICSPDRFNFYFQLGIPYGEISESEVDEIVTSLNKYVLFKEKILQLSQEKRLRKILAKLLLRRDRLNKEEIKMALLVLWDAEKEIDDEPQAVFDLDDVATQILRLGFNFLKVTPKEERTQILIDTVSKCVNIYHATHLVAVLRQTLQDKGAGYDDALLDDNQLKEIENILLERIKTLAQNKYLEKEKNLVAFLYRWKEWGGPEEVKKYISQLTSTETGLLSFLKSFVSKVLSTNGNYSDLNKKSIEGLCSIGDILLRVGQFTDEQISKLSPQEQEAIKLFNNSARHW
ncbi:MAG: P-loop NTPase fold protein [Candidatus Magasanikbacteria bacterium]